jgi:hypothetical protein
LGPVAFWERKLSEYIESYDKEFELGSNDCIHFAVECERVIFGDSTLDHLEETHSYRDLRSMIRLLVENDCVDVFEFVSKHKEEININMIQRGDWVGVLNENGHTIGVWDGRSVWVTSHYGLIPLETGEIGWRVR